MMQLITADYFGNFICEIAEMLRLCCRVFPERLDWEVHVSSDMEIDAFDALHPVYLLKRGGIGRIQGCVRLLPPTCPAVLRDTLPVFSNGTLAPAASQIWEGSRFALDIQADAPKAAHGLATATYELFAGIIEFDLSRRLTDIVTVTDARIEVILRSVGLPLRRRGKLHPFDGTMAVADLRFPLRAQRVSALPAAFRVPCSGHLSRLPQR